MFRNRAFRIHYSSEEDNIYEDFYAPALECAVNYKRAVGYFSLGAILNAPTALSHLVANAGKIKIIFAKIVSENDLEQLRESLTDKFTHDIPSFLEIIENHNGTLIEYRIRLLAYLFNSGQLEMKIAFRKNGLFHQKIGIMEDASGDLISFNGSMNETNSAFDPEINSEEITVFKSWDSGQKDYVMKHLADFDKLWHNVSSSNTFTCDLPEVLKSEISIIASDKNFMPSIENEFKLMNEFLDKSSAAHSTKPRVPETINGNPFVVREHQKVALDKWKAAGFKGILELATGTGKTITSIYALTKIYENIQGLSVIISVPYVNLADQWIEELKLFNISAVKCYGSRDVWKGKLSAYALRNQVSQSEFIVLVVVNKTFNSEAFQSAISDFNLNKTMFIGDECHHHTSESFESTLPFDARFKLGLSATPFHYMDEEANQRLRNFYGDVVYKYSLFEAIENGILTKYEYHPIPVVLTDTETDEYYKLSEKIGKVIAQKGDVSSLKDERLQSLLMRRARLIGTAKNKLVELDRLISGKSVPNHSLFYCSDGRVSDDDVTSSLSVGADLKQRQAVGRLLRSHGVPASFFTADESRTQRQTILENFKSGEVKSLVAIRCLDEGIDVPACSTAYILASSKNPRQFIQRRGRILRKSPGKEKAVIFDFVVVLPPGEIGEEEKESDFFKGELLRVADFAKHSLNPVSSLSPLNFWLDKYDLHHLVL